VLDPSTRAETSLGFETCAFSFFWLFFSSFLRFFFARELFDPVPLCISSRRARLSSSPFSEVPLLILHRGSIQAGAGGHLGPDTPEFNHYTGRRRESSGTRLRDHML